MSRMNRTLSIVITVVLCILFFGRMPEAKAMSVWDIADIVIQQGQDAATFSGPITANAIRRAGEIYNYNTGGALYWAYLNSSASKSFIGNAKNGTGYTYNKAGGSWIQCVGFAFFMGWALTGEAPEAGNNHWTKYASFEAAGNILKPGDIVAFHSAGGDHAAMVYIDKGNGTYTFINVAGSSNLIKWNAPFWSNGIDSSGQKLTHYPANSVAQLKSAMTKKCYQGYVVYRYSGDMNFQYPDGSQSGSSSSSASSNPYAVMTVLDNEDTGYYRISGDTGDLKAWPYANSNTLETKAVQVSNGELTSSDILHVVRKVKNTNNNIWALVKTSENQDRYAYLDDLEFLYRKKDGINRTGTVYIGTIGLRLPVPGAASVKSYLFDTQEAFEGTYQDYQGNMWLKVKDRDIFIPVGALRSITQAAPNVTFTGSFAGSASNHYGYPTGNLNQGVSFGLRGTVKANEPLHTVTGRVIDRNTGNVALNGSFAVTVTTDATSYNVTSRVNGECINDLPFGNLPAGAYRYEIAVTLASGFSTIVHTSNFTVGNVSAPANTIIQQLDISFGSYLISQGEYPMDNYDERCIGDSPLGISAIIYPTNATNQAIAWTSSNPQVVSVAVDPYGDGSLDAKLTICGVGQAVITANTLDGSNLSASFTISVNCTHPSSGWVVTQEATNDSAGLEELKCAVCGTVFDSNVIPPLVTKVTQITAVLEGYDLYAGWDYGEEHQDDYYAMYRFEKAQLIPTVYPSNATCKDVVYSSDNEIIASVDATGMVTAHHTGWCNITISAVDGSNVQKVIPISVSPYVERTLGYTLEDIGDGNTDWRYYSERTLRYETWEDDNVTYLSLNLEEGPNIHTEPGGDYYLVYAQGANLSSLWLYNNHKDPASDESAMILNESNLPDGDIQRIVYLHTELGNGRYMIGFTRKTEDQSDVKIGIIPMNRYFYYDPELYSLGSNEDKDFSFTEYVQAHFYLIRKEAEEETEYRQIFESTGDVDVTGTLIDPWGNVIATDDDSGEGKNLKIDVTLKTNRYYILVVKTYEEGNTGTGYIHSRPYQPVTGIECPDEVTVYVGQRIRIPVTVQPSDVAYPVVFDEIEDEICLLDTDGYVTGYSAGIVTTYIYPADAPQYGREVRIRVIEPEVMTHAEFYAAAEGSPIVVETYIQAWQGWQNGKINLYAQSPDGGYFIHELSCTEEEVAKLTVEGRSIIISGNKAIQNGEVEIVDATYAILENGSYIPEAYDITGMTDSGIEAHMNEKIVLKSVTVEEYGDSQQAVGYENPDLQTGDLFLTVSGSGRSYCLKVESALCGSNTEVYQAVEALNVGDIIDLEGFLYWYYGAYPHITNVTVISSTVTEDPEVLSYTEFLHAECDTTVCIETYVQATQSWFDNKINVYAQSPDGAYFIYNMSCTEEDAGLLTAGTPIRVIGRKAEWAGEIEIADATFTILGNDPYVAEPEDVTSKLGTDELITSQNKRVTFKGMRVEQYDDTGAAFAYQNAQDRTGDLYFMASKNGWTYMFCVEFYLCGPDTEVYQAVEALNVGDIIDLEGFLYWYNGANPHITSVTVNAASISVIGVSLNKNSMTLNVGDSETLTATVTPYGASDKGVTWSSDNTAVATVNSDGTVNAVATGNAIITVQTNDGGKTATCIVTVENPSPVTDAVLTIPTGVVRIEEEAFSGIAAEVVRLPDTVTSIGAMAFAYCSDLKEIHIPSNCNSIDETAFYQDGKLTIYCSQSSYAKEFAIENNIPYVCLDAGPGENEWVLESEVPTGARITDTIWFYRESVETTASTYNGWTADGSYWRQTGSGSKEYAEFPSTYKTSHPTYTELNGEPYNTYENESTRRIVTNSHAGYIYWHWSYNANYATNLSRWISDRQQTAGSSRGLSNYYYNYFFAFKSTTDAPALSGFSYTWGANAEYDASILTYNCANYLPSGADTSAESGLNNPRFMRLEYYTSAYTDYEKVYKYYRDIYSENDPGNGSNITNKTKYVKWSYD